MASKSTSGVPVAFDAQLSKRIAAYCEYYAINENDLVNDALAEFFEAHRQNLDALVKGYVEMGQLNSEIAHEFSSCEAEADLRILR
ncbi:hypothetical protein [Loigolactobacillus bifermentans]|jgi:CopG family transcriptional regulator/antitoxin EndoAI|uniref:Antitoxin n=1 Tax=Loigolactobacillus bifermentans DSM 20003 TaxID=1423726 RepID=A0A0R1HCT8_9LACO|nr:hypothetical protein [Loigolactobacillus bifermentans]KRK40935.1 hypothetical protein FC07_GL002337 [Loigolactobacillus bifermentans DSM 20003]QGG61473.1 hypothetical protein LB003_13865 [Loigolactobacillus bifermentans]